MFEWSRGEVTACPNLPGRALVHSRVPVFLPIKHLFQKKKSALGTMLRAYALHTTEVCLLQEQISFGGGLGDHLSSLVVGNSMLANFSKEAIWGEGSSF